MEQWKHAHPLEGRETLTLQQLTLSQAAERFPDCDTEELKEMLAEGPVTELEPDYLRLFTHQGRLLSCVYEVSYLGWSVWADGHWRDLDDADWELEQRLNQADLIFLPPVS